MTLSKIQRFRDLAGCAETDPRATGYQEFMEAFGFRLPEDYLAWAREYSTLNVCGEMLVNNLISTRLGRPDRQAIEQSMSWALQAGSVGDRLYVYNGNGDRIGPLPGLSVFPQEGGIFPWGNDNNGALYMWDAQHEDPSKWTVVAYDGDWYEFGCGFLDFMLNLFDGNYSDAGLFLKGWPWVPAVQEYAGEVEGVESWHVPSKWIDFFDEYQFRLEEPGFSFKDMAWVDRFKQ